MEYQTENKQCHSEKIDEGRRIRRALRFKAQLRLHIEACGEQRKNLASACDSDQPQLCRWEGDQYRDRFPADELESLTLESGYGLLAWICDRCDADLIPRNPARMVSPGQSPVRMVGLLARKAGALADQVLADIESGGVWRADEKRDELREVINLETLLGQLRARIQGEMDRDEKVVNS